MGTADVRKLLIVIVAVVKTVFSRHMSEQNVVRVRLGIQARPQYSSRP